MGEQQEAPVAGGWGSRSPVCGEAAGLAVLTLVMQGWFAPQQQVQAVTKLRNTVGLKWNSVAFSHCHTLHLLRSSLKVVKAAAQVLNTLWQYRDLRSIYKKVNCEISLHWKMVPQKLLICL